AAISDLQRAIPAVAELDLPETYRIAGALLTWFDLLHPHSKDAALARLRGQMADPETALPRLQFAFAFDPNFDPTPIVRFIDTREKLGGFADEQLRAAFVLQVHIGKPRAIANFTAKHRARLETLFGKKAVVSFEVQALARAQDATSARLALNKDREVLDPTLI